MSKYSLDRIISHTGTFEGGSVTVGEFAGRIFIKEYSPDGVGAAIVAGVGALAATELGWVRDSRAPGGWSKAAA